jgi:uncharacterized protein YbjT (DUF2867 family)
MKSQQQTQKKILVLGGTGKTGSRIVKQLNQLGKPVRPGSRSGEIPFDWEDQTTWKPVLQNVETAYISFQPDLAVPGTADVISAFVKTAIENGIKKLVLLSGRGEPEAQQCEKAVMHVDVNWTIIRSSWFCQNFSEGYLLESILAGYLALPVGDIGEPFIDVDDIAELAVDAIITDKHINQVYEVTGPRLLTFKEAVNEIAKATGRTIQYEQVTMQEYTAMLTEYNVPPEFISLITYLFAEVLDGRNEYVADGVKKALGRKPADFSAYISKALAKGVWEQALV